MQSLIDRSISISVSVHRAALQLNGNRLEKEPFVCSILRGGTVPKTADSTKLSRESSCSCSCLFPVLNFKPLRLELDHRWGGIGSLQVAVSCSLSLAGVGGQFRLTICVCMMCMVLAFNLPRTCSSLPLADTFKVSHLFLLTKTS